MLSDSASSTSLSTRASPFAQYPSPVSKLHILDLPRELIERILDELPRPRHLYPLLLTSKTVKSFALPRLYTKLELRSEDSVFLSPGLLDCLLRPTAAENLVHTRTLNLKGSLKNIILRVNPNSASPNAYIQGMCRLLRQIVSKIPTEQLLYFEWNINFCPHPVLLRELTTQHHHLRKIFVDSPHENTYCECLPSLLTCCSEMREFCFRKISHPKQLEQISQVLVSAKHLFSVWLGLRKRFDTDRRRTLRFTPKLIESMEKLRLREVSLSYMPLPLATQQSMRLFDIEFLVSLTLRDCEGDKALLAAMRSTGKLLKLREFKLITGNSVGIPEFLNSLDGLRLLHMFYLDLNLSSTSASASALALNEVGNVEEMEEDSDEDDDDEEVDVATRRKVVEFGDDLFEAVLRHSHTLETFLIDGQRREGSARAVLSQKQWGRLRDFTKVRELGLPYEFSSGLESYLLPLLLPPTLRYLSLRNRRGMLYGQQSKPHIQYLANGIYELHYLKQFNHLPHNPNPCPSPPQPQRNSKTPLPHLAYPNTCINPHYIHTLSVGDFGSHNTTFYNFFLEEVRWGPMVVHDVLNFGALKGDAKEREGGKVCRLGVSEVTKREAKAGALPGDVEVFGFWY